MSATTMSLLRKAEDAESKCHTEAHAAYLSALLHESSSPNCSLEAVGKAFEGAMRMAARLREFYGVLWKFSAGISEFGHPTALPGCEERVTAFEEWVMTSTTAAMEAQEAEFKLAEEIFAQKLPVPQILEMHPYMPRKFTQEALLWELLDEPEAAYSCYVTTMIVSSYDPENSEAPKEEYELASNTALNHLFRVRDALCAKHGEK